MGGMRGSSEDRLRAMAITITGLSVAFSLVCLVIGPDAYPLPGVTNDPANGPWTLLWSLCFGVAGLMVTLERPRNPIGWILLLSALFGSLSDVLGIYGTRALADPTVSWPFGLLAVWAAGFLWFPALLMPLGVLPQVYPDGRPIGPRWRWALWFSVLGLTSVTLVLALSTDNVNDWVQGLILPFAWPEWLSPVVGALLVVGLAGVFVGLVAGVVGLGVRFRHGGSQARGQIIWLFLPVVLTAISAFLPFENVILRIWYPLVAVAVAIGVLGYELLGINVTVRRALVYLPLTLVVALLVGAISATISQRTEGSEYGVVIAAIAIAVLVLPLRDALMRATDRLLYGRRSDPVAVMGRIGSADPEAPDVLLRVLAESVRSPGVELRDVTGVTVATVGTLTGRAQSVPLGDGSAGELVVSPRRGERTLDPADARLLAAVTPYWVAALRAQALARDLESEREQVMLAAGAERARLRQDLHDGLGPALSGIALGAEAAHGLVRTDPDAAMTLIDRIAVEATAATEEVRRVIDDLRPSALDSAALGEAIRLAADRVAAHVSVEFQGDLVNLPPDVASTAYRIAAEALTNVARHASATRCCVRVGRVPEGLVLSVRDDGRGIHDQGSSAGVGLESMRRRAAVLGGHVTVRPNHPTGTEVSAMLPVAMGSS
jgi:signal transduction histidine kinase